MDLVSYLSWGSPGAGPLSGGPTAERSAPWERGCGVEAGAAPLRLPPRVGGSGLSPGGREVQARAGGSGEDAEQTAPPGDTMASPAQGGERFNGEATGTGPVWEPILPPPSRVLEARPVTETPSQVISPRG